MIVNRIDNNSIIGVEIRRSTHYSSLQKWSLKSTMTMHWLIDWLIDWLIGVSTARQHRKVNLCQLRGKETGTVS